jgi:hypothetical protein
MMAIRKKPKAESKKVELIFDSGCSNHMTNFMNLTDKKDANFKIKGAFNNSTDLAKIKGNLTFKDEDNRLFTLPNTLLVPNLRTNLLSIKKICNTSENEEPKVVIFDKEQAYILPKKNVMFKSEESLLTAKVNRDGIYSAEIKLKKLKNEVPCKGILLKTEKVKPVKEEEAANPKKEEEAANPKKEEEAANPKKEEEAANPKKEEEAANLKKKEEALSELELWHRRLGHINVRDILRMKQEGVIEMKHTISEEAVKNFACPDCQKGKQVRKKFKKETIIYTTEVGEEIVSDLCGPIKPMSINHHRYYVTFIDTTSREVKVYFMKKKSETIEMFRLYKAWLFNQRKAKIKTFRSDKGGEFEKHEFKILLLEEGVEQIENPTDTPQRTGIAERFNRTVCSIARNMLLNKKVPKFLWPFAILYATDISNTKPRRVLNNKSPIEIATKQKPNYIKNFKVFGSLSQYRNEEYLYKLTTRSHRGIYLGYDPVQRCDIVYNPENRNIVYSRDVIVYENLVYDASEEDEELDFNLENKAEEVEEERPKERLRENSDDDEEFPIEGELDRRVIRQQNEIVEVVEQRNEVRGEVQIPVVEEVNPILPLHDPVQNVQVRIESLDVQQNNNNRILRPRKEIDYKKEQQILNAFIAETDNPTDIPTPLTYKQAINSEQKPQWEEAMETEINNWLRNKTFEVIDNDANVPAIISSKWVYKPKFLPNGDFDKFRARIVGKGFMQTYGVNYFETFAPVARLETLRYALTYALEKNYKIYDLDVVAAFLIPELKEDVYLRMPQGCGEYSNKVVKLNKAIYGLKQASNAWNENFTNFLKQQGYKQSESDPCLLIKRIKGEITLLILYVDNAYIIGPNSLELANKLKNQYEMTDNGELKSLLGMNVIRNENSISIDQELLIKNAINKLNLGDTKSINTPSDPIIKDDNHNNAIFNDNTKYRSAIGILNYIARCTRPDIYYIVNKLSQKNEEPTQHDWNSVKRVFQYLKSTINKKLTYINNDNDNDNKIIGYADASYAEEKDRKSITGFCFKRFGGVITWRTKKQNLVTKSSTEAEYVAISTASDEVLWLQKLVKDIHDNNYPILIREDNQSCIKLIKNFTHSDRSKHIDVRYHSIRERLQSNQIEIEYCPTTEMTADVLTKALPAILHCKHTRNLGVF